MKKLIHKFKGTRNGAKGQKRGVGLTQPVDPQDDVGTFSGFDSWLSSFMPDPHGRGIAEMPVQPVHTELLNMKGSFYQFCEVFRLYNKSQLTIVHV